MLGKSSFHIHGLKTISFILLLGNYSRINIKLRGAGRRMDLLKKSNEALDKMTSTLRRYINSKSLEKQYSQRALVNSTEKPIFSILKANYDAPRTARVLRKDITDNRIRKLQKSIEKYKSQNREASKLRQHIYKSFAIQKNASSQTNPFGKRAQRPVFIQRNEYNIADRVEEIGDQEGVRQCTASSVSSGCDYCNDCREELSASHGRMKMSQISRLSTMTAINQGKQPIIAKKKKAKTIKISKSELSKLLLGMKPKKKSPSHNNQAKHKSAKKKEKYLTQVRSYLDAVISENRPVKGANKNLKMKKNPSLKVLKKLNKAINLVVSNIR